MGFDEYAAGFFRTVAEMSADGAPLPSVDPIRAAQSYPRDTPEVAQFKWLFDFGLDAGLRDRAVREMFTRHVGDESAFAESLYLTWDDARKMQKAGMSIGGHSYWHTALANLTASEAISDLETCHRLLHQKLLPQPVWSFSYPYGKKHTFHLRAVRKLQELNFRCAFTTEACDNRRGADPYMIGRTDCRKALMATAVAV